VAAQALRDILSDMRVRMNGIHDLHIVTLGQPAER
jgi:hypothetical protein